MADVKPVLVQLTKESLSSASEYNSLDLSDIKKTTKEHMLWELDLWDLPEIKKRKTYIRELSKRFTPALFSLLNQYHKTNFSDRYWRVLVGPWLDNYIYVLYQRYKTLKDLYQQYGCFRTAGLDLDGFICPVDTHQAIERLKQDAYNLQLYTKLIKYLSCAEIVEYVRYDEDAVLKMVEKKKSKYFFLCWCLLRLFNKRKKIFLFKSYFPKKIRFSWMLKSFGKVMELPEVILPAVMCYPDEYDSSVRNKLVISYNSMDEFEAVLCQFVLEDMPVCFIEGYARYRDSAERVLMLLGDVHGFLTANAWYTHEGFKQVSALGAERGVFLYGVQHGGDYGNTLVNSRCDHEQAITDGYYTWGWSDQRGKSLPMPANKLVGVRSTTCQSDLYNILYGLTAFPRFDNHDFVLPPSVFANYLNDQKLFINALSSKSRQALIVRTHIEDMGWQIKERLTSAFPEIKFDNWGCAFMRRLREVKLYICDHLSTTHIEALALGKPTVLFWRPEYFPLSAPAKTYYQGLKDVGILFDDPIAAANAVSGIIKDVEKWWVNPARQEAVKQFCWQYGRISRKSAKIWLRELKSLV